MTMQPLCLNDITVFAPPCLTPKRAWDIYEPAFRRIVEYAHNSRIDGDVLEFGTFNGYTARVLAELMREYGCRKQLHLYDSWEGFPVMRGVDAHCPEVTTHDTWHAGDCKPVMEQAPEIIRAVLSLLLLPESVHTHKGFFDATTVVPQKAAIVHVDCDLYESTVVVLRLVLPSLQQGSVIMFDDWNNNMASDDFGERMAVNSVFPSSDGCRLEPWFSYGSSGQAFIVHRP